MMRKNLSTLDRGVRGLVAVPAAVIAALVAGAGSAGGVVVLGLAAIMLATSDAGVTPPPR